MFDYEPDPRSSSTQSAKLAGWAARAKEKRRLEGPEPRLAAYARHVSVATGIVWFVLVLAPTYYLFRFLHRTDGVAWENPYLLVVLSVGAIGALLLELRLAKRSFEADRSTWWRACGRCAGCGYDLTATPEKCPECGRRVMKHF